MFRSKAGCRLYGVRETDVSILVLVDVPLEVVMAVIMGIGVVFQSLFSWMFRSKPLEELWKCDTRRVSILVLVDVPLEGRYRRSVPHQLPDVSILVLVDVPLEVIIDFETGVVSGVSILVLVDVPLEA